MTGDCPNCGRTLAMITATIGECYNCTTRFDLTEDERFDEVTQR